MGTPFVEAAMWILQTEVSMGGFDVQKSIRIGCGRFSSGGNGHWGLGSDWRPAKRKIDRGTRPGSVPNLVHAAGAGTIRAGAGDAALVLLSRDHQSVLGSCRN